MYEPILKAGSDAPPEIRAALVPPTGDGVIDVQTFKTLEIDRLFDAVNHSETIVGQATLYRSLTQPLVCPMTIEVKQDAVQELQDSPEIREQVESLVAKAARDEKGFFTLLYGTFLGFMGKPGHPLEFEGYGYESYSQGTRFMLALVAGVQKINRPKSIYLNEIFDRITGYTNTRWYALMAGPAYKTEKGFVTKYEKKPYTPAFIFKPTLIKPLFIGAVLALVTLAAMFAPFSIPSAAAPALMLFFIPLLGIYVPIVGTFDRDSCIYPLRESFRNSQEIESVLEALGQLDELLSLVRYGECFATGVVRASVRATHPHTISLQAIKNPILATTDSDYVANDVELDSQRLTFITGPNSGGKTAICKTLAQVQILSQIGCPIPGRSARMAVADHIFYQIPEFSSLDDGEGRFGTELKRTKEIFLACTDSSLVILDELSEGTTHEEKLEMSSNILNGFLKKGNSTVLITHNHELVDQFDEDGIGCPLQVEFKSYNPTYRLIVGVSRVSHADRVAKKIGFSKEDIDNYLSE